MPSSQTCHRCYKMVPDPCRNEVETEHCKNLERPLNVHPYRVEQDAKTRRWNVFGPSNVNVYEPGFVSKNEAERYAQGCIRYDNGLTESV